MSGWQKQSPQRKRNHLGGSGSGPQGQARVGVRWERGREEGQPDPGWVCGGQRWRRQVQESSAPGKFRSHTLHPYLTSRHHPAGDTLLKLEPLGRSRTTQGAGATGRRPQRACARLAPPRGSPVPHSCSCCGLLHKMFRFLLRSPSVDMVKEVAIRDLLSGERSWCTRADAVLARTLAITQHL